MSLTRDPVMNVSLTQGSRHLALDNLVINPKLARRLPPAIAFRYHALPLAEGRRSITVAMADPEDKKAVEAIAEALGREPYIVKSETSAIDSLLAEIWPDETHHSWRLLAYHQASPVADQLQAYAERLCELLGGHLHDFQDAAGEDASFKDLVDAAHEYDLIVFGEPNQTLVERLLSGRADLKAAELIPTSVLIVRQPRWPVRKTLLITRGHELDDVAVDWITRLAQASNAAVSVLAVVPDLLPIWSYGTCVKSVRVDWLASDTPLGRQLRRINQRLSNTETESTLRFRQGSPARQIECELVQGDYDLIVTAADPSSWWLRRLLGELVTPLLDMTDTPVLIARNQRPPVDRF